MPVKDYNLRRVSAEIFEIRSVDRSMCTVFSRGLVSKTRLLVLVLSANKSARQTIKTKIPALTVRNLHPLFKYFAGGSRPETVTTCNLTYQISGADILFQEGFHSVARTSPAPHSINLNINTTYPGFSASNTTLNLL